MVQKYDFPELIFLCAPMHCVMQQSLQTSMTVHPGIATADQSRTQLLCQTAGWEGRQSMGGVLECMSTEASGARCDVTWTPVECSAYL